MESHRKDNQLSAIHLRIKNLQEENIISDQTISENNQAESMCDAFREYEYEHGLKDFQKPKESISLHEDFELISKTINEKAKHIEAELMGAEEKIREKCAKIRNEVVLAVSGSINELINYQKELIKKIDAYEIECHIQLKLIHQSKQDMEEILLESQISFNETNNILQKFKLKWFGIRLLDNLNKLENELDCEIFNNKRLTFGRSTNWSAQIGHIHFQDYQLYFLEEISNVQEIDLAQQINENLINSSVCLLENSNIFYAHLNINNNLNFVIIDRDRKRLVEKEFYLFNKTDFSLMSKSSNNVIYFLIINDEKTQLLSMDQNLNIINQITITSEIWCILGYGNYLFLYSSESFDFNKITMYTTNLEFVKQIGQSDPKLPYYLSNADSFLLSNENYFILDDSSFDDIMSINQYQKVSLINKESGLVEKSFKIKPFKSCIIYLDKYFLTFNEEKLLCSYDLDGNLLNQAFLFNVPNNSVLKGVLDKKLYFFDPNKLKFYYF